MRVVQWLVALAAGVAASASAQAQSPASVFGLSPGDALPPQAECRPHGDRCRLVRTAEGRLQFSRVEVQGNALAGVCSIRAEREIPLVRAQEVQRFVAALIGRWRQRLGEPLWGQDDLTPELVPGEVDSRMEGRQLLHALWRLDTDEVNATGVRLVRVEGVSGPAGDLPPDAALDPATPFDTARITLTVQFVQSAECAPGCDDRGQRILPTQAQGVLRWRCVPGQGAALVPGFNWGWSVPDVGAADVVLPVAPQHARMPHAQALAALHFVRIDAREIGQAEFEAALGGQAAALREAAGQPEIAKRVRLSGDTSLGDRFRIDVGLAAAPDAQARHGYAVVRKCAEGPCSEPAPGAWSFVLSHLPRRQVTRLFNALPPEERRARIAAMVD